MRAVTRIAISLLILSFGSPAARAGEGLHLPLMVLDNAAWDAAHPLVGSSIKVGPATGFVAGNGFCVTNRHVIANALSELTRTTGVGHSATGYTADPDDLGLPLELTGYAPRGSADVSAIYTADPSALARRMDELTRAHFGEHADTIDWMIHTPYNGIHVIANFRTALPNIHLVFAPGDVTSGEHAGHAEDQLDLAVLRLVESGTPDTSLSELCGTEPLVEDALVYSSGHPNGTHRFAAAADLELRLKQAHFAASRLRLVRDRLSQLIERSEEHRLLFGSNLALTRNVLEGETATTNGQLLADRIRHEQQLSVHLSTTDARAFREVNRQLAELATNDSHIYGHALQLPGEALAPALALGSYATGNGPFDYVDDHPRFAQARRNWAEAELFVWLTLLDQHAASSEFVRRMSAIWLDPSLGAISRQAQLLAESPLLSNTGRCSALANIYQPRELRLSKERTDRPLDDRLFDRIVKTIEFIRDVNKENDAANEAQARLRGERAAILLRANQLPDYPEPDGSLRVSSGRVCGLHNGYDGSRSLLETSLDAAPGSSGAPVVNAQGKLGGIVSSIDSPNGRIFGGSTFGRTIILPVPFMSRGMRERGADHLVQRLGWHHKP